MVEAGERRLRLPGMELLGFFDEPYRVRRDQPPTWERPHQTSSSVAAPTTRRGSLVADLWDRVSIDDSFFEAWRPGFVARRKLGGRRHRLTVTAPAGLVVVLISALVWHAGGRAERMEVAADAGIRSAAAEAASSASSLESLARSLAADQPPDLGDATATLLAAEAAARTLFTGAGAVAEASETRLGASGAASALLEATDRLGNLMAYRLAARSALAPPSLPSDVTSAEVTAATRATAAWRAEMEAKVEALPASLESHRRSLAEWTAGLDGWQTGYLDAFASGEAGMVAKRLEGLEAGLGALTSQLRREVTAESRAVTNLIVTAQEELSPLIGA